MIRILMKNPRALKSSIRKKIRKDKWRKRKIKKTQKNKMILHQKKKRSLTNQKINPQNLTIGILFKSSFLNLITLQNQKGSLR